MHPFRLTKLMIRIYGIVRQSGCIALHYYVYILGIFSFVSHGIVSEGVGARSVRSSLRLCNDPPNISWDIGIRDVSRLRREFGVTFSTGTVEGDHLRRPCRWHSQGPLTWRCNRLFERVHHLGVDLEFYKKSVLFNCISSNDNVNWCFF